MAAKRNYKDSMFRAIFKDKRTLLSLYNAIRKTSLTDWRAIRLNSLKGVLFNIMRNDLSFTLGEEEIILMEEQSTPNGNMPLRLFFYLAKLYQHSVAQEKLYRQATTRLPAPHFYVFCVGRHDLPPVSEERLSTAFATPSSDLELVVHIYNITDGIDSPLFPACPMLHQYSQFVSQVEARIASGHARDAAIRDTIRYCMANNILYDFLKAHDSEVYDMVSMKFDMNTALRVAKEEAREAGWQEGKEQGMQEGMQEGIQQGMQQGMQQGIKKGRLQAALETKTNIILQMLKKGMRLADIAGIAEWPAARIIEIAKKNNLPVTE